MRKSFWVGALLLVIAFTATSQVSLVRQATIESVFASGERIVVRGSCLISAAAEFNEDRSVFSLTGRYIIDEDPPVVTGEWSGPVRDVTLVMEETERGTRADITVVAQINPESELLLSINEDASELTLTFRLPAPEDEPEPVVDTGYEAVTLQYASADGLAQILRRLASGGDRSIQVEPRLNLLVIDRSMDRYADIMDLVDRLDRPGQQILIDAQIVELRSDAASQLGLDLPSSISMSIGEDSGFEDAIPFPLQTFLRSPIEISATLDLLSGDGRADVLANPRVATIDGIPAVVQTQERFPIIVTQTSGSQTFQTKQDIVGGISLSITPRHNGDGEITTVIETDVTTITGTTKEGFPTTSSRQVSTTVRVQSGQAIVIGGLQERREIVHDDKFPLLGDIPLLGLLFTNRREKITEADLYVIVTPYLIGGEG